MERNHALDYARAAMLTLGIPYHVACAYQIGGGWLVDAQQPSFFASILAAASHSFRMPAFFILSGFFASMVLARRKWHVWLKDRARRVLLPAISTTVLIGPILIYLQTLGRVGDRQQSWQAMVASLPFGSDYHAWFLAILFSYCLGLAATGKMMIPLFDSAVARAGQTKILSNAYLNVLVCCLVLAFWAFAPSVWLYLFGKGKVSYYLSLALQYLPFFLIGIAADRGSGVAKTVFRPSSPLIIIGIASVTAYIVVEVYRQSICSLGTVCEPYLESMEKVAFTQSGLFGAMAFFGLLYKMKPRENAYVSYLVSGALVIYLFHMPAVMALSYLFRAVHLPAIVEMLLLNVLVLAWSVFAFEVIRRSKTLLVLFNGGEVRPQIGFSLGQRATLLRNR